MDEMPVSGLIWLGTVTDRDADKHMVRVKFQDSDFTSGWLYVLQRTSPREDAPSYWMPRINDTVLCVYLPIWNGDGFVVGGVC